jgi:hypothetical protein
VRLSPDSARTKNAMAKMVASQKTARTAFDLFILDSFSARQRSILVDIEPPLTLCGSTPVILRRKFQKRQAESLCGELQNPPFSQGKGNRTVTSARRADVLPDFEPTTSGRANERLWFLAADFFQ